MTALLTLLLLAPAEPTLADLDRFPTLPAVQAQLGALIRVRHTLRQGPATKERDQALAHNARQLAAWELLLESHGGLAEEGERDDESIRKLAIQRLHDLLTEADWRAGRMP